MKTIDEAIRDERQVVKTLFEKMRFKSKTPKGLATEIKNKMRDIGCAAWVWTPEESVEKGFSKMWHVGCEGAPFDWTKAFGGRIHVDEE